MVERYDLTINRNEDNITYNFPFFDIGITLTGEKTEPTPPEPEGPITTLPFTKKILGTETQDFTNWSFTYDKPYSTILTYGAQDGYIIRSDIHKDHYRQTGEGYYNDNFQIKGNFSIICKNETYYNLILNEPTSTLSFDYGRNNVNGWTDISLINIEWTSTRPSSGYYMGYDKTTDTLYGNGYASTHTCEYYSPDYNIDRIWTNNNEYIIENVWNATVTGASNIIPSLKNIN